MRLILHFEGKFVYRVFQELQSVLVLTFEFEVNHTGNRKLNFGVGFGNELIILACEDFFDFIKSDEWVWLKNSTVRRSVTVSPDEEVVILVLKRKRQVGLLLPEDIVFFLFHDRRPMAIDD